MEEARKDIRNMAKETKKMCDSVSSDLKKINKNGQLDGFNDELKKCQEEVRKVKVNLGDGISFSFNPKISGDFQKKINEISDSINKELEEDVVITPKLNEDDKKYLQYSQESAQKWNKGELSSVNYNSNDLNQNQLQPDLQDFDTLTIKDELKTIGMQIAELIPQIKSFGEEAKKVFTEQDRLIPQVVNKVREFGVGVSYLKNQTSQAFEPLKSKISEVKDKIVPVTSIFSNIGKVAKNSVIQASTNFKELANSTNNPIGKINSLIKRIKGAGDEADKTNKKGKNFGTDFGKSLEKGIGSIKKFALSLLSVRSAFSLVSRAAQSYLSFDTSLNDSLQNSWNTLGSLLAPALEYVAGLFSKLTSAVALLVKSLTGIDLVAKANAKSLDKQSKSAKSASQSLSGIDDIDTLSTGSGSDNDTPTITTENIDISPLEKFANQVKKIFSTLFQPLKTAWESVGKDVFDSMTDMFNNLGELCSSVFSSFVEVWTNGTGTEIIENVLLTWQQLFDIVGAVAEAINLAWENNDNGAQIIQHIADIFKDIQKFVLDIGNSLVKWIISEDFQNALEKVFGFINDLSNYVHEFADWLLKMYETYLKPVIDDKLLPAISDIVNAVMDVWNAVKPVIDFIIEYIENQLEPVIQGLCDFIGGIIDIVSGIAKFISGVFTGDWKKAWDGVKNIFKGFCDTLSSLFTTPLNLLLATIENFINAIIGGFNLLKKGINKLSIDIPSWLGGGHLGFDLKMTDKVTLPRLKSGQVAYDEQEVIIGEYANARNNPEIVSPVSMMADTFRNVLREFDFGGTRIDTLKIDVAGDNFFEGAIDYINEKSIRKGVSVIKEV